MRTGRTCAPDGTEGPPLSALPQSIEKLVNLDSLYLEDNKLTNAGLPDGLGACKDMKGITLQRNRLTAFPMQLIQCRALEEIYFDGNEIGVIPDEIGFLKELREIGFQSCGIKEIPRTIGHCVKIEIIHIEHNQLEVLPKTMGRLQALTKIYLNDNKLVKLHASLGKCPKMQVINAEDNHIKGISKKIAMLPKLKHLLLANNELKELPPEITQMAGGLRRLTLSGNKLQKDVMKLEKLGDLGGIAE